MAFATFYRYEFTDFPSPSSGLSQWLWRVSFLRDGYSGSIATIRPGDNPLTIEIDNQSDSRFSGAMAEKYNFELICDDVLQASQLYVQSDDEVQILIERDTTNTGDHYQVYSRGWLLASEIKEAYEPKPYPVTVSGICGLARLKSRPFLDETGKRLQGFVSLAHAIRLCLFWAGHSTNLIAAFNLYELSDMVAGQTVSGHADPSRCPLYQTLLRAEWFLTSTGTPRMCEDVLKAILGPVMRLEQLTSSSWLLIRADEATGGWDTTNTTTQDTIRARQYTSSTLSAAPDDNGSGSINLNLYTEAVIGETMVEKGNSAYTWKGITKPGIRVEQSFGDWINKLPNAGMDTVDATGLPTGWFTNMNLDTPSAVDTGVIVGKSIRDRYRIGDGTNNSDYSEYAIHLNGRSSDAVSDATEWVALTVEFDPNSDEYTQFKARQVTGEFRVVGAKSGKMFARIQRDDGVYLQLQSGFIALSKAKTSDMLAVLFDHSYKDSLGVMHSKVGWSDFTFDLGVLDRVKNITIYLCVAESLDAPGGGPYSGPPIPYVEYRRIKLTSKPQDLTLNGQQKTIVRPGKTVNETTASLTIGDVPIAAGAYDRINTLFNRGATGTPVAATRFFHPTANALATNPTGYDKGYSWVDWVALSEAYQFMFPSDMISGNLAARLPHKAQTIIHLFDIGETVSSTFSAYAHQITRWRYVVRDCSNEITAQRIAPSRALNTFETRAEWQTPDGLLPMSTDDLGNPAQPAFVRALTEKEKFLQNLYDLGYRPNLTLTSGVKGFTSAPQDNTVKLQLIAMSGGRTVGSSKNAFVINPRLTALTLP